MTENSKFKCINGFKCLLCERFGNCAILNDIKDRERLKQTIWYNCEDKYRRGYCATCERVKECRLERGLEYRKYTDKNIIINTFPDSDKVEILYYKKPFLHLEESENLDIVDRHYMLEKNKKGEYVPVDDGFSVQALQRSIRCASKRSKDKFYGYAKANDWDYYVTLTFSPEIVNRYDDNAVKALWTEFQRYCKRKSSDVKMLMVPERHKDRAIHFHGFISNISFDLELAQDAHTGKYLYTKVGTPLFSIKDWKYGFSFLDILPKEGNYDRVCNYIQKYISKDGNLDYCQKRFYHTQNLMFKNKSIFYGTDDELNEMIKSLGLEPVKDTDKMIIFRKPAKSD